MAESFLWFGVYFVGKLDHGTVVPSNCLSGMAAAYKTAEAVEGHVVLVLRMHTASFVVAAVLPVLVEGTGIWPLAVIEVSGCKSLGTTPLGNLGMASLALNHDEQCNQSWTLDHMESAPRKVIVSVAVELYSASEVLAGEPLDCC